MVLRGRRKEDRMIISIIVLIIVFSLLIVLIYEFAETMNECSKQIKEVREFLQKMKDDNK